jgi:hypothetical protein
MRTFQSDLSDVTSNELASEELKDEIARARDMTTDELLERYDVEKALDAADRFEPFLAPAASNSDHFAANAVGTRWATFYMWGGCAAAAVALFITMFSFTDFHQRQRVASDIAHTFELARERALLAEIAKRETTIAELTKALAEQNTMLAKSLAEYRQAVAEHHRIISQLRSASVLGEVAAAKDTKAVREVLSRRLGIMNDLVWPPTPTYAYEK